MKNQTLSILKTIAILLFIGMMGCNYNNSEAWRYMDSAEAVLITAPDSSLIILKQIDRSNLHGDEEKARYALLMSMALDKNYVDTTTFDVLQPAIDYYLKHGSPDQQLRTLYYQGRIFQNKGDFDMAMQSFLRGEDLEGSITDSLTFGNMLVAQGKLYSQSNQMTEYINLNLNASTYYNRIGMHRRNLSSLIRALSGSIVTENRQLSDSIINIINQSGNIDPLSAKQVNLLKLSYGIQFDKDKDIEEMLDSISSFAEQDAEAAISVAVGYLKLDQADNALKYFNSINPNSEIASSARYKFVRARVLEATGNYKEAYEALNSYIEEIESEKSRIYSHKTLIAQKQHDTEIETLYKAQKKDKILLLSVCIAVICALSAVIIYYFFYTGRLKRIFAENEKSRLALENENLNMKIDQLEEERDNLKILADNEDLSSQSMEVVKKRLEMLNGILASSISKNDAYSRQLA